jgi:putative intracellular protease/amidase
MFDMNRNETLHKIIVDLKHKDRVLSGVCHATSTFALVHTEAGPLVADRKITGFPHSLDRAAVGMGIVDTEFLPLPFSNEREIEKAGADLKWHHKLIAALNPLYTRTDWPFVTGVGPKAARVVAKKIIHRKQEK